MLQFVFAVRMTFFQGTNTANILQPNFGGSQALSMSPSGQMMRTSFVSNGTPTAQVRPGPGTGGQGWSMPTGLPGSFIKEALIGSFHSGMMTIYLDSCRASHRHFFLDFKKYY